MQQLIILVLTFFGVQVLSVNYSRPIVHIPDGVIEGVVLKDYDGFPFYGFRNIPFAKPPLGKYRFRATVKNDPWDNILDGSVQSPLCLQPKEDESAELGVEDCLYLNVYTPAYKFTNLKPVLVHIHGGKFVMGYAGEFEAEYIMTHDIVVVTINYRLGVYGFLHFQDRDNPNNEQEIIANNGLKDQVFALKWIQENIEYFGGNPKQVTLAGESSGGLSVHCHILSPLSRGLFHGAILMSGTALSVWSYSANNTAIGIAKYLNIDTSNETAMINELKVTSNSKLFRAAKDLRWFRIQLDSPAPAGLAIEKPGHNSFISSYPLKIIQSGNYNKVPMLLGNANNEGLFVYAMNQDNLIDLRTHIPFFFKNKLLAEEEVKNYYKISAGSDLNNITMYSDAWFKFSIFRTALEHLKSNRMRHIYHYEFSGDGSLNFIKTALYPKSPYTGACHADELGYLYLCSGFSLATRGSLEEKLMRIVTKMFGNFIKTGIPFKTLLPFKANEYNFVNITNDGMKFGVSRERFVKFWINMYEKYSNGLY